EPFDMSLPAVSKHLKVLERAGLVARGREAQWRPAALEAGPLKAVDDGGQRYRRLWGQRRDRLDDYLKELQHREKKDERKPRDREGLRVAESGVGDQEGWEGEKVQAVTHAAEGTRRRVTVLRAGYPSSKWGEMAKYGVAESFDSLEYAVVDDMTVAAPGEREIV